MSQALISSLHNPLIKRLRRLRQKKYRQAEGVCFIEGVRLTLAALELGATVEMVVRCEALLTSPAARAALAQTTIPQVYVTETVFRHLSERDNPVGLGAVVRPPQRTLSDWPADPQGLYLALDRVADPGNLGTIVRTVDSVGGQGVILVGETVEPYHPAALKASLGAVFRVLLLTAPDLTTTLAWGRAGRLPILATSAHAPQGYWEARLPAAGLVVLGSEREGLPPEVLAAADWQLRIPMWGVSSSLNLAVAAGLIVYEMRRQREMPAA